MMTKGDGMQAGSKGNNVCTHGLTEQMHKKRTQTRVTAGVGMKKKDSKKGGSNTGCRSLKRKGELGGEGKKKDFSTK